LDIGVSINDLSTVFWVWELLGREAGSSHISMLARQISNLALVRLGGIALWNFSGAVWVQVRASGSAVQARDGEFMDVIHCGGIISS
jgi:hypothetical protein